MRAFVCERVVSMATVELCSSSEYDGVSSYNIMEGRNNIHDAMADPGILKQGGVRHNPWAW